MCSYNFLLNSLNSLLQLSVFSSHDHDASLMSFSLNSVSSYTQEIKPKNVQSQDQWEKILPTINDTNTEFTGMPGDDGVDKSIKYNLHTSIVYSSLVIF